MALLGIFLLGSTLFSAVFFGFLVYRPDLVELLVHPRPPLHVAFPFDDHVWTASNKNARDDEEIVPFHINISQVDLDDLQVRLKSTRFPKAVTKGVNFTYGFHPDYLKKVADYWTNDFNWRKQEAMLNQYPHYKTEIEGLDVHFVHIKADTAGKQVRTYPLLMLHGWPGSFFELYKMAALLQTPREYNGVLYALDLVIPSLPGYGFSEAPEVTGMDPSHIARIMNKLMTRLGYDRYFAYGGDWGAFVARYVAVMYPERVLGIDISLVRIPVFPLMVQTPVATFFPSLLLSNTSETYKLLSNWSGVFKPLVTEFGYMHMFATKPYTVAAGTADSPMGLAAWILMQFSFLTKRSNIQLPDGGLPNHFTLDDLLTNVAIYWFTETSYSSFQLYKENCGLYGCGIHLEQPRFPVKVPTVFSDFRWEAPFGTHPTEFIKPFFPKLICMSHHPEGGHFSTMERPQDLTNDIWILVHNVAQGLSQ